MTEEIRSGIELMFVGMGIVFLFLVMLVFAINLMSALVQRYFPDASSKLHDIPGGIDKGTVAAITAAVHQYRNKHQ
jgi:oxaloacetate decarboxylase (Na+ extruding) subunit gamma